MDPNNVNFTAPLFSLPLFMVSRNRIKYLKFDELKKLLKKNINLYTKHPNKEFETATLENYHHVLGLRKSFPALRDSKVVKKRIKKVSDKSCHLPPNRYDTNKIPYSNRRGLNGAFWPKVHLSHARHVSGRKPGIQSVYFPRTTFEEMFAPCQREKGVFLSNARERRPSIRCMVSNIVTCYRDPSEPGAATYNTSDKKSLINHNVKKPNPHLFYPKSTVPVKANKIHPTHISFHPAPGRYEVRYPKTCPCSSKLRYEPQIDILIEREKRLKFRRLHYKKMKANLYASPDWNHVKGRGFCYLFKGAKPTKPAEFTLEEGTKLKTKKLYPDSKYISMINNPQRIPMPGINIKGKQIVLPIIKFNCIAKIITRKQLKSNKKIVFNSTQERFPDSYRLPVLTQWQQELIKQTLPLERQLRDHPIMIRQPSEIQSKLSKTPKHMLPNYVPKLRKKEFKFLPLPPAKILVTDDDMNINQDAKEGFYYKILDPKKFYKDSVEVERKENV